MFIYLVSIAYDYSTFKQSRFHVRPTEYFTSATAAYTFAVLSPWQARIATPTRTHYRYCTLIHPRKNAAMGENMSIKKVS